MPPPAAISAVSGHPGVSQHPFSERLVQRLQPSLLQPDHNLSTQRTKHSQSIYRCFYPSSLKNWLVVLRRYLRVQRAKQLGRPRVGYPPGSVLVWETHRRLEVKFLLQLLQLVNSEVVVVSALTIDVCVKPVDPVLRFVFDKLLMLAVFFQLSHCLLHLECHRLDLVRKVSQVRCEQLHFFWRQLAIASSNGSSEVFELLRRYSLRVPDCVIVCMQLV